MPKTVPISPVSSRVDDPSSRVVEANEFIFLATALAVDFRVEIEVLAAR